MRRLARPSTNLGERIRFGSALILGSLLILSTRSAAYAQPLQFRAAETAHSISIIEIQSGVLQLPRLDELRREEASRRNYARLDALRLKNSLKLLPNAVKLYWKFFMSRT